MLPCTGAGGHRETSALPAYLFGEPTHLNDIWEPIGHVPGVRFGGSKPVFVLTSKRTFSGGEEFAYNLKNLKRATLIGETTGGGAHPVQPFTSSEHFAMGVPFARAISPITKTNWEGPGVAPDIALPKEEALDAAYVMALEKILETATDERRKGQLRNLIKKKS